MSTSWLFEVSEYTHLSIHIIYDIRTWHTYVAFVHIHTWHTFSLEFTWAESEKNHRLEVKVWRCWISKGGHGLCFRGNRVSVAPVGCVHRTPLKQAVSERTGTPLQGVEAPEQYVLLYRARGWGQQTSGVSSKSRAEKSRGKKPAA